MNRIYLDHASATPVAPEVVTAMTPFWAENFGNPSSIHTEGVLAKRALAEARKSIATILDVQADEIIFTGSATESCNLALIGTVRAWKKTHSEATPHCIVSEIEHDAVLATAKFLEGEGARISYLPVDSGGIVQTDKLAELITKDTVIISVMLANNEIGTSQPVAEIAKIIRAWKKDNRGVSRDIPTTGDQIYPLLHSDACQATNYLPLRVPVLGVDLLTINGAKIYGPKGVALLVSRRSVIIEPVSVGGGHEGGKRAGTENVPLIVGLAHALEVANLLRDTEVARLTPLRDALVQGLSKFTDITMNGSMAERLPNNIHFSMKGVDHEFIALLFDKEGISVATKSACNELDAEHSHVLLSMIRAGHNGEGSGIRMTLGRGTTAEDIDIVLQKFSAIHVLAIASRINYA